MRILPPQNYLNTDAAKDKSRQGFRLLKEPFGTNRVYLLFNQGAWPKRKIDTAVQADGVPASIAVKPRASCPWGVAMLQSNRVPETRTPRKHRRGQPKSPCRHRHFHRGLGPNRFDQRGDAQACRVLLAGPGLQVPAQELSPWADRPWADPYRSSCDGEPCDLDRREALQVPPDFACPHSSCGCDSSGNGPLLITYRGPHHSTFLGLGRVKTRVKAPGTSDM